jgi:hypothetical protein
MLKIFFAALLFTTLPWRGAMGNPLEFRDNLAAFYGAVVRARETGQTINIHIVGDSKVAGTGVSAAYTLDKLLGAAAKGYPVNVTYDGFGGQNSWLWANGKAGDFVAAHANASLTLEPTRTF